MARRRDAARVVAPVAFLAAATAAVLLIRAGIQGGDSTPTPTPPPPAAPVTRTATKPVKPKPKPVKRFYIIESGDTYAVIASRFGTTVDQLRTLNPGVDEHALTVGQRIRVK